MTAADRIASLRKKGAISAAQAEYYEQEALRRPGETAKLLEELDANPAAGSAGTPEDMQRLGFPGGAR